MIRILPHIEEFFDEWITNKARFIYDSFNIQRLWYPKLKLNSKFIQCSWYLSLHIYIFLIKTNCWKKNISIFCGPYISLELSKNLKFFFQHIGCSNLNYIEPINIIPDFRYTFLFNNTLKNIDNSLDFFLIGCNLRLEAPLLNSILRKFYLNDQNFKAYNLGLGLNYSTYPLINLGSTLKILIKIFKGKSLSNKYFLSNDFYNLNFFINSNIIFLNFFVGSSSLLRKDHLSIYASLTLLTNYFNNPISKLNIITRHLGRITAAETNIFSKKIPIYKKKNNLNLFIACDLKNFKIIHMNNLNIFLGFFFLSDYFECINLIFSSQIYVENIFCYLNLEGRFRSTNKVITPAKTVFPDYHIIYSLSILSKLLIFNNFSKIINFNNFISFFLFFYEKIINFLWKMFDEIKYLNLNTLNLNKNVKIFNIYLFKNKLANSLFNKVIANYYTSDIYSINSKIMSLMSLKIKIPTFSIINSIR